MLCRENLLLFFLKILSLLEVFGRKRWVLYLVSASSQCSIPRLFSKEFYFLLTMPLLLQRDYLLQEEQEIGSRNSRRIKIKSHCRGINNFPLQQIVAWFSFRNTCTKFIFHKLRRINKISFTDLGSRRTSGYSFIIFRKVFFWKDLHGKYFIKLFRVVAVEMYLKRAELSYIMK